MKVLSNVLVSVQTECTHLLTTHADAELALTLRTQTILVKESQVIQQTVSLLFSTVVMVPMKLEVLLVTANNSMIVVMNVMEDQAQETKSLVFVLALLPYQLTNFVIKNVELTPLFKASPHHLKWLLQIKMALCQRLTWTATVMFSVHPMAQETQELSQWVVLVSLVATIHQQFFKMLRMLKMKN